MKFENVQKSLYWAIVASETSHVFCCILPTLFSVFSLFAGLGLIAAMPPGLEHVHELIHNWEMPIIIFSGAVIAFGWLVHYISEKLDCRSTGCVHEPCAPKKKKAGKILAFATALFAFNLFVFLVFHHGLEHFF